MKSKKGIAIILLVSMMFSLLACGNQSEEEMVNLEENVAQVEQEVDQTEVSEEPEAETFRRNNHYRYDRKRCCHCTWKL